MIDMATPVETILSSSPASTDLERLMVVLCQPPGEPARVELRQQSFAPGLGWFNQSTVRLEPSQVAGLRMALGAGGQAAATDSLPKAFRQLKPANWQPRVIHADSASA